MLEIQIEGLYEKLKKSGIKCKACIGLDGFIDRVLWVVDKRIDGSHFERVTTLYEYGRRIMEAAGLSLNVEMVPTSVKYGGNGPIMANAIGNLGIETDCIGAFGINEIYSVFGEMQKVKLHSIAEPANTDAVEFYDGKIITSVLDSLNRLTWENLEKNLGIDLLYRLFDEANLIAMNNWTMIPSMTTIWERMLREIFPRLKEKMEAKVLFFDLADPSKRTNEDIIKALHMIKCFSSFGKVIISCNERELCKISDAAGLAPGADIQEKGDYLRRYTGVSCVAIHMMHQASATTSEGFFTAPGYYTPEPKIGTGGGDHFNAGFCYAVMQKWTMEEALFLGNLVSGAYVRSGKSPNKEDIIRILKSNEGNAQEFGR